MCYDLARLLLKNDADVNIGNCDGLTPLHAGMDFPHFRDMAKELLEHGANVNATVTYRLAKGVTPLSLAVERGRLEVVKFLLENGADPSIPCYDDQTILQLAVDCESVDIIECILEHHPNLSNKINKKVPCKGAFQNQRVYDKIADLLRKHNFNFDVGGRSNIESLHNAICENDYATVKQLIEAGLNVNIVYRFYEAQSGCIRSTMPLFTAVRHQANDIAKLLISHGADVNAKRILYGGETLLEEAVRLENAEATMLFLSENVKFSDHIQDVALLAIKKDRPELLEKVLRSGAKVNGTHLVDETASMNWADKVSLRMVKVLVKYGAQILSRAIPGVTALHAVCDFKNTPPEVVKHVIQNNADVEARNCKKQTAILRAARAGNLGVVLELLKYGARVDVVDCYGDTPFHDAIFDKRNDIFRALLEFHFADTTFVQRTNVSQIFNRSFIKSLRASRHYMSVSSMNEGNFRHVLLGFPEMLAWHMIKLKAAFHWKEEVIDFCSVRCLQSVVDGEYFTPRDKAEWIDFQRRCESEVARLQAQRIGDSVALYYDVLTKSEHEVACYLKNENIFETLSLMNFETEFPIYSDNLRYQFEKGKFRRELLNQSITQFHLLAGVFGELDLNLKEKVLSYMNNRELEVALYACESILSRQ